VTTISLGPELPPASNDLPGRCERGSSPVDLPYLVFLRVGFTLPVLSPGTAVRSYRTLSALPPTPKRGVGGLLSVALSLASRPVAVSNHTDPRSPDFPPSHLARLSCLCLTVLKSGRLDLSLPGGL
jgi:hypothetical protein